MSNVTVMNFKQLDFDELDFDTMNFETLEPIKVFASDSALRKLEAMPSAMQPDRQSIACAENVSQR